MIILYSIPVCSKSRKALDLLQASGLPYEVRDYLQNPLSREELADLVDMLGLQPSDIIRMQEPAAREFLESKPSPSQWLDWLTNHPECMQRPIARINRRAWVVRPGERIQEVIQAYRSESKP